MRQQRFFHFVGEAVCILTALTLLLPLNLNATDSGQRLALVIGNSQYTNSPLVNPVNDAEDMAAALQSTGFEVILKTDASQRAMERAVRDFGRRLRSGGVGLFYYAGHGLQIDGRNYLIPVDAEIESESDVKYESVDAGRVLGKMEDAGNGLNIVILDACRDNPFARSFRSSQKGLAKMDAPVGSLLAYATAPGSTAADGTDRNGLYTSKLLKYIHTPGIKIEDVFKQVRREVMAASGSKQVPWESSSMAGDFYFTQAKPKPVVTAPAPKAPTDDVKAKLAALEAERQRLEAEKALMVEKQRLAAIEKERLAAEKKLLAEQRRLTEEKEKIQEQKEELAALQAKISKEQKTKQDEGSQQMAYSPSAIDQANILPGHKLALLPLSMELIDSSGWAHRNIPTVTRAIYEQTVNVLLDENAIRLTQSAVSRKDLGRQSRSFKDIRIISDELAETDLKALWYRPSLFSKEEPNLKQIVTLGKRMGVDLVLMHKVQINKGRSAAGNAINVTVFLIDVEKKTIHEQLARPETSSTISVKNVTAKMLDEFLKSHPLSAVGSG